MATEEEREVFQEDDPPGPVAARARALECEVRAAIRNVLTLCRRRDGRLLHDVAVLRRVSGATLALVRQEREYLRRAGLLSEQVEPDDMALHGRTV